MAPSWLLFGKSSWFFNLKLLANFKLNKSLEFCLLNIKKSLPYVNDRPPSIVLLDDNLSKVNILFTSSLLSLPFKSSVLLFGLIFKDILGVNIFWR